MSSEGPVHCIQRRVVVNVFQAAIGMSGQKASCRPVDVQDMLCAFNLVMSTYSNNIGSIEDAKQFCLEFSSRMIK